MNIGLCALVYILEILKLVSFVVLTLTTCNVDCRSTSFQGRILKDNLDSQVVDALKDLKRKLLDSSGSN